MGLNTAYYSVFKTIAATSYGKTLAQNIRFGRFPSPKVTHAQWEKALGDDVNNLRHMWYTKKFTDQYIALNRNFTKPMLDAEDEHYLRLTATFHDLAEAVVGDIPKVYKTTNQEQDEKVVLENLVDEIWGNHPRHLPLLADLHYCIDTVIFSRHTK